MMIRLYAWPNRTHLELSVVQVDMDDRGRELVTALVRCDVGFPDWMRHRGVDLAYVAARAACEMLTDEVLRDPAQIPPPRET